ncbi:MAG: glycosyltransferase family 2 protein [Acidobacteriaceae bacterium]
MALFVFWLCIALIAYTYVGYPLLLRVLAALIRRPLPEPSEEPTLTLLICAHNEAASIREKILDTLALHYPPGQLQILVASDGSTDETDEIVSSFAGQGVRLVRIPQQAGKTHAQNIAVQQASGDVIVFSDATTRYHPDALRYLAGHYEDPHIGAVSGSYLYLDPSHTSATGVGAKAYASYDNTIRNLQSRVWSISGCCGCIYSVRRALYTPLADDIISDLVQPLHILHQGYRVAFEPRAIASESSTASPRREFSMRVRVMARAVAGLLSVPDLLLPWNSPWIALQLWSHKLLRWMVPLFLAGLFFSSACLLQSPFYGAVFLLQALFYATAILTWLFPLHRHWRPLGLPLYFCTVNLAIVGGLIQLMRGHRYTIWSPERRGVHADH